MDAKRVKVTRNGQTTIPKEFRKSLGIEEGSILVAEAKNDTIVFRRIPHLEDLAGSLSRFGSVDALKHDLDRTRGEEE